MTRFGLVGGMAAVVSIMACAAHAADVDWKVYGFASVSGPEVVCFYEAISVARAPDGSVRVWTKCLAQKDLDAVDIKAEFGGKIVENAARKMLRSYLPPLATVEDIDFDQASIITAYEETANISYIKPHSTIFYEFNCAQKMIRELSIESRSTANWADTTGRPNGNTFRRKAMAHG